MARERGRRLGTKRAGSVGGVIQRTFLLVKSEAGRGRIQGAGTGGVDAKTSLGAQMVGTVNFLKGLKTWEARLGDGGQSTKKKKKSLRTTPAGGTM